MASEWRKSARRVFAGGEARARRSLSPLRCCSRHRRRRLLAVHEGKEREDEKKPQSRSRAPMRAFFERTLNVFHANDAYNRVRGKQRKRRLFTHDQFRLALANKFRSNRKKGA